MPYRQPIPGWYCGPVRRLLARCGFLPYLRCCPIMKGHRWRPTHGDERLQAGAIYVCRDCPRRTDRIPFDALPPRWT